MTSYDVQLQLHLHRCSETCLKHQWRGVNHVSCVPSSRWVKYAMEWLPVAASWRSGRAGLKILGRHSWSLLHNQRGGKGGWATQNISEKMYEQLGFILADARRRGFSYVVGGDFNSQLDIGVRGELLDQFCQACHLSVLNRNAPVHESWTFESCMGIRRRIDFLLCHVSLSVHAAAASHEFDIGPFMDALMLPPPTIPMQDVLADNVDGAQIRRQIDCTSLC